MRKFTIKLTCVLVVLLLGITSSRSAYAFQEGNFLRPVPTDTGGEEEKKKDQQTSTDGQTADASSSTANEGMPADKPAATISVEPKPKPVTESKPAAVETKTKSFNFLFDMLYHFNIFEMSKTTPPVLLEPLDDPYAIQLYGYQAGMTLVSY